MTQSNKQTPEAGAKRGPRGRKPASGYQGVYKVVKGDVTKWRAMIWVNGRGRSLGRYVTRERAALARAEVLGDTEAVKRLEALIYVAGRTGPATKAAATETRRQFGMFGPAF